MITSLVLLDPELALGTLLVLRSLNEFDKLFIILIENPSYTELFASHPLVILDLALQAVHFIAERTVKLGIPFKKVEHVFASS